MSRTLAEAKQWLQDHIADGAVCPCCDRYTKLYKRNINSSMAYVLILIHNHFQSAPEAEWLHVPSYLNERGLRGCVSAAIRGDWAKLTHWNLLTEKQCLCGTGTLAGYYKITARGVAFAQNTCRVAKSVYLRNNEVEHFSDDTVSIRGALGKKFNYSELLTPAYPR